MISVFFLLKIFTHKCIVYKVVIVEHRTMAVQGSLLF